VITYLNRFGLKAEARDKASDKITAFRRNIYFPGLLQEMQLSGHKDERFLIKIECQDQQVSYNSEMAVIRGCGFFFPFPVPPDTVLCSMKISSSRKPITYASSISPRCSKRLNNIALMYTLGPHKVQSKNTVY